MTMAIKQRIVSSLWFDDQAEEAAKFYTSIFPDSHIDHITRYGKEGFDIHQRPEGSVMTVDFTLSGQEFCGLNGGPLFKFNPSISYFVVCETEAETDKLWGHLSAGGMVLMPLDKYDWSEKYGWVQDRYGLSWQIAFGKISDTGQKITPSFLFANEQHGRAEEAIHFYTSIFDDSSITGMLKYGPGGNEPEGTVNHAQFKLAGQTFMAMDSAFPHQFSFNDAISMMVQCETQKEIDFYWDKLTAGGEEVQCGWLKDKFGVAWQVNPIQLSKMLLDPDKKKTERVTRSFLKMKKFDLAELQKAFAG